MMSEWVEREYKMAIAASKRIVPICLDDTPMPSELSKFHASKDILSLFRSSQAEQARIRGDAHAEVYPPGISYAQEDGRLTAQFNKLILERTAEHFDGIRPALMSALFAP